MNIITFKEFAEKYSSFIIAPSSSVISGGIEIETAEFHFRLAKIGFPIYKEGYANCSDSAKGRIFQDVPFTLIPFTDEQYKEIKIACLHYCISIKFLLVHNSVVQCVYTENGKTKIIDKNFNPDKISEYMRRTEFYNFSFTGILEDKDRLYHVYSNPNEALMYDMTKRLLKKCAEENIDFSWAIHNRNIVYDDSASIEDKKYYKYSL